MEEVAIVKKLAAFTLVLLASLGVALPALAGSKWCISEYQNGELCWRHCDLYDDQGNLIGSITEDYNC